MINVQLKYETKDAALVDLMRKGWKMGEDGSVHKKGHHIVFLGTLYDATGKTSTDDEGFEYPEVEAIDGYHLDILCPKCEAGCYNALTVKTPKHKWSGHE